MRDNYRPIGGVRGAKTTVSTHVRFDPEQYDECKRLAAERGIPAAVFIRDLITEGLAARARTQ